MKVFILRAQPIFKYGEDAGIDIEIRVTMPDDCAVPTEDVLALLGTRLLGQRRWEWPIYEVGADV